MSGGKQANGTMINVIALFKAFYRPMIDYFIGEHNEAALQISEVYSSRGSSYLNIIIENMCYSYSFDVRPRTF